MKHTKLFLLAAILGASTSSYAGEGIGNGGSKSDTWDIQLNGQTDQAIGSLHVSCGASVANGGRVNCEDLTINVWNGDGGEGSAPYDDSAIKQQVADLEQEIERVDDEDQRVVSGSVSGSNLELINRDEVAKLSGEDINKVNIDLSGLTTNQGDMNSDAIADVSGSVGAVQTQVDQNTTSISNVSNSVGAVQTQVNQNTTIINGVTNQVADLSGQVDQNTTNISANNSMIANTIINVGELQTDLSNETQARITADGQLASAIQVSFDTLDSKKLDRVVFSEFAEQQELIESHQYILMGDLYQGMASIENSLVSYGTQLNNLNQRTTFLEQENQRQWAAIDDLKCGVASSAALAAGAGLFTQGHGGQVTVIPSMAYYDGCSSLAIQTQIAVTEQFSIRLGFSNDATKLNDLDKAVYTAATVFQY